jgi:siroheme decarboxylase
MLRAIDRRLIAAVQDGLPLVERPFQAIGEAIGRSEDEVIAGLQRLIGDGTIKRFGIVIRHRELGWRANAMVVWDVPDEQVEGAGRRWPSCRSSPSAIAAHAGRPPGLTTCSA